VGKIGPWLRERSIVLGGIVYDSTSADPLGVLVATVAQIRQSAREKFCSGGRLDRVNRVLSTYVVILRLAIVPAYPRGVRGVCVAAVQGCE
jgi:hypothetical protein